MGEVIAALAWAAVELLLLLTGRALVLAISLGRWRAEGMSSNEGSIYGAAGALSFKRDGKRVVTCTGQVLAGFAFYFLLIASLILLAAQQ
ncbi:MAG: hypothetical protein EOO29_04880 [Comamonadaceae bacterium]|nr:MAG: hypothetical protein EOO29_04880 [Comamonadaceae bacterium]